MNVEVKISFENNGKEAIDHEEFERFMKLIDELRNFETENGLTTTFDVHVEDFKI